MAGQIFLHISAIFLVGAEPLFGFFRFFGFFFAFFGFLGFRRFFRLTFF